MAIISVSRLQHRRGIRADLPETLNEGELGWCLDSRELFIGNSNAYTGNSQVLTEWSRNDEIIRHIYTGDHRSPAHTGAAGRDVRRPLGEKLDDVLSVKDYGAVGNGIADDTDAIQRAVADTWLRMHHLISPYTVRSEVHFPAGEYLINRTIDLYPYVAVVGEGMDRTQITLKLGATGPIFRTVDSEGKAVADIGTNGAVMPLGIKIAAMTLNCRAAPNSAIIALQRVAGTVIDGVRLQGDWQPQEEMTRGNTGIVIENIGLMWQCRDITVTNSEIRNCRYIIYSNEEIVNTTVRNCLIDTAYRGIFLAGGANGATYFNLRDNVLRNIDNYALDVQTSNPFVTSIGNQYINCGRYDEVPAINWANGTTGCSSIGDVFSETDRNSRIYNGEPEQNIVFNAQQPEVVSNRPTPIRGIINPHTSNGWFGAEYSILTVIESFAGFINYSMTVGSYRRAGQLQIISDGYSVNMHDNYTELGSNPGVSLTAVLTGGMVQIHYTNTSATAGSIRYIETFWAV